MISEIHIIFFFWFPKILTRQGPSNKKSIRYGLNNYVGQAAACLPVLEYCGNATADLQTGSNSIRGCGEDLASCALAVV